MWPLAGQFGTHHWQTLTALPAAGCRLPRGARPSFQASQCSGIGRAARCRPRRLLNGARPSFRTRCHGPARLLMSHIAHAIGATPLTRDFCHARRNSLCGRRTESVVSGGSPYSGRFLSSVARERAHILQASKDASECVAVEPAASSSGSPTHPRPEEASSPTTNPPCEVWLAISSPGLHVRSTHEDVRPWSADGLCNNAPHHAVIDLFSVPVARVC